VTYVAVARAPLAKLEAYRKRMGWGFELVSSYGSDFNCDFNVSFRPADMKAGRAVYNVVPEQAGLYFQKLECFCFSQYTLAPGEKKQWPVAFVIDPKLSKDVSTITLSYTFFEVGGKTPAAPATPKATTAETKGPSPAKSDRYVKGSGKPGDAGAAEPSDSAAAKKTAKKPAADIRAVSNARKAEPNVPVTTKKDEPRSPKATEKRPAREPRASSTNETAPATRTRARKKPQGEGQ